MMMNRFNKIEGFTLIEVLTVLLLTGVLAIMLGSLFSFLYNYWVSLENNIDIRQQARVISSYLEKDIKRASGVKVSDIDSDGTEELLLSFAASGSCNVADYIQYNIKNRKLAKKKPAENVIGEDGTELDGITTIGEDLWPLEWGNNSYLTLESTNVLNYSTSQNFIYFKFVEEKVFFKFKLVQQDYSWVISNIIHPRNLN